MARVDGGEDADQGPEQAAEDVDRSREPQREGLGVREGERLGHELAEHDGEQRQQDRDERAAR